MVVFFCLVIIFPMKILIIYFALMGESFILARV